MKFSCSRDELQNALTIVQRGVSTRSTMPILEGILFNVYDGKLHLTATDLEIGVLTEIPAEVEQDGTAILSAALIIDVVRKLAGDQVYFCSDDKNRVKIENLLSEFTINGFPADDYPEFPTIKEAQSFQINPFVLRDLIRSTSFSVALSENIPVLTGIKIELSENNVRFVALDGYRMAIANAKLADAVQTEHSVIVPGKSMVELQKILGASEDDITVAFSSSQIFFTIGSTVFTTRLLDGQFINYDGIIPKESMTNITIEKSALLSGCERAALMARAGKNNLIKMTAESDRLTLTSNADIGDVHEVVSIKNDGDSLKIAFNSKFFIDALKAIEDDTIRIELTTAVGPAVIRPTEGTAFTYLVLPVRVAED